MGARGVVLIGLVLAIAAPARAADELERSCRDDRGLTLCSAPIASFDGTPLDATVTLPAGRAPRGGRPLIVFLHGLLADKGEYLADTPEGTGPERGGNAYKTIRWNNRWFAARGYTVLNYSARGHGASGGSIELASRDVEVRDARRLAGLLADAPWAGVDPRRIGVIGSSYGGGQAWLLLATREDEALPYGAWRSPAGRELRLAALVPGYTWTDLVQSLLPNGHEDSRAITDTLTADTPLGVAKQTLLDGFIATAGDRLPGYVRRWLVRTNAGEPYDPASDATLAEAKQALTVQRSAYFQEGYFAALSADAAVRARVFDRRARCRRTRSRKRCARAFKMPARRQFRVPVLAAQGWTDPIFAPIEAVRMYKRLRFVSPGYPVGMYLGDFEHLTALVKLPDLAAMHDEGTALLDRALLRRGKPTVFDVRAAVTDCDPGAFGPLLQASSWEALAPAAVTFELSGPRLLSSAATEGRGAEIDPVVVSSSRGRGCLSTTTAPSAASWTVSPARPFTMAGLPRLTLRLRVNGSDATLLSRLWDVAPDGRATLVSRGALRLSPPPADGVAVTTEMFGNAWSFKAGHAVQLELSQTDATFFRPDNLASSITVDDARLELPATATP
jgi:predicted acyl esterase